MRGAAFLAGIVATTAACTGELHENIPPEAEHAEDAADASPRPPAPAARFDPDIQNDVDSYGCSMSGCHGSGTGGFQLTARSAGGDVNANYEAFKMRTSKVLVKATGGDGHGGGARFAPTDAVYDRWSSWIAQGAPR